ncbi:MAG TPA: sugar ABC transporter ATP-binding protein [Solirubrobacteraceae bacterium]|nr:sugar ABC transporter ATP-binding protein [Solirubrobacteraceae bacterium]
MIEAHGISKSYGGVQALADVDFAVRAGTVHALLGENGAGKSTLVKIIAGALRADSGAVRLDGSEVSFATTADAAAHGVGVVSQELNLFDDLDLLSNLFPQREPLRGPFVDRAEMTRRARPVLHDLGLSDLSLRRKIGELSLAERQLVEIAKALVTQPRVLVLDEPTSALEATSSALLIEVVRVLRERRVAVVYVSHILQEVMSISDEVTVLRDGRVVMAAQARSELSVPTIVAAMLGEHDERSSEMRARAPRAASVAAAIDASAAEAEGADAELRFADVTAGALRDVSFTATRGEVVGLTGLTGAGHATVLEVVTGQLHASSGTVTFPGRRRAPRSLRAAISSGVALVTGDRKRFGLMLDKPTWDNIAQVRSIALRRDGPLILKRRLRAAADEQIRALRIRTPSADVDAGRLSGGNQQKVVFAKWLEARPSIMVLDDPTRGVDVGAKVEMHTLIHAAADANALILLSSTDLDELVSVCDRVLVFFQGAVCAELEGPRLTVRQMLESMNTGTMPAAA